jgi:hypothetical protein
VRDKEPEEVVRNVELDLCDVVGERPLNELVLGAIAGGGPPAAEQVEDAASRGGGGASAFWKVRRARTAT